MWFLIIKIAGLSLWIVYGISTNMIIISFSSACGASSLAIILAMKLKYYKFDSLHIEKE
jgi:hypothetical protein